jgi:hypothetical protein
VAWGIWLIRGFIEAVPKELDEAAMVDGCSRLRALWHVTLPVAAKGLVASGILLFIGAWNEFTLAFFLTSRSARTYPNLDRLLPQEDHGDDGQDLQDQEQVGHPFVAPEPLEADQPVGASGMSADDSFFDRMRRLDGDAVADQGKLDARGSGSRVGSR